MRKAWEQRPQQHARSADRLCYRPIPIDTGSACRSILCGTLALRFGQRSVAGRQHDRLAVEANCRHVFSVAIGELQSLADDGSPAGDVDLLWEPDDLA